MGGGLMEFPVRGWTESRRPLPAATLSTAAVIRSASAVPADGAAAGHAPAGSGRCISRLRSEIRQATRRLSRQRKTRHDYHRYTEQISVPGTGQRHGGALRRRRRPSGVHLGGDQADFRGKGMAGGGTATRKAGAAPRPAPAPGKRPKEPAPRTREVSGDVALSPPP